MERDLRAEQRRLPVLESGKRSSIKIKDERLAAFENGSELESRRDSVTLTGSCLPPPPQLDGLVNWRNVLKDYVLALLASVA